MGRIRGVALERLRDELAIAFDDEPASPALDRLARFALAAFEGAFVASCSDRTLSLEELLQPLAPALVAARRSLMAKA